MSYITRYIRAHDDNYVCVYVSLFLFTSDSLVYLFRICLLSCLRSYTGSISLLLTRSLSSLQFTCPHVCITHLVANIVRVQYSHVTNKLYITISVISNAVFKCYITYYATKCQLLTRNLYLRIRLDTVVKFVRDQHTIQPTLETDNYQWLLYNLTVAPHTKRLQETCNWHQFCISFPHHSLICNCMHSSYRRILQSCDCKYYVYFTGKNYFRGNQGFNVLAYIHVLDLELLPSAISLPIFHRTLNSQSS